MPPCQIYTASPCLEGQHGIIHFLHFESGNVYITCAKLPGLARTCLKSIKYAYVDLGL